MLSEGTEDTTNSSALTKAFSTSADLKHPSSAHRLSYFTLFQSVNHLILQRARKILVER